MIRRNVAAATKWRACAILGLAYVAGCGGAPAAEPVEEQRGDTLGFVDNTGPQPMPGASPFAYPVELWDRGIEGESMLMVHVTERGAVDSAYVLTSSGFAEFDSAAVHGAHALQFTPARRGDERIAMWTRLPVRFSMDSLAAPGGPSAMGEAVPTSLRDAADSTNTPHD